MLSAIGVAAAFIIRANNLKEVRHCTASQGLLIAVKARGPSADVDILKDYQLQVPLSLPPSTPSLDSQEAYLINVSYACDFMSIFFVIYLV